MSSNLYPCGVWAGYKERGAIQTFEIMPSDVPPNVTIHWK